MPTTPFADLDAPDPPPLVEIDQLHLAEGGTRVRVRGTVIRWQLKKTVGGELWGALTLGSVHDEVVCLFFPKVFGSVAGDCPGPGTELEIIARVTLRERSLQLVADAPYNAL